MAVAIISAVSAVLVAILGTFAHQLKGIKKDASEARWQVKNSHKSNMRDDLDDVHQEIKDFREEIRNNHQEVIAVRQDIRYLTAVDREQWSAISKLQDTQNRSPDA